MNNILVTLSDASVCDELQRFRPKYKLKKQKKKTFIETDEKNKVHCVNKETDWRPAEEIKRQ